MRVKCGRVLVKAAAAAAAVAVTAAIAVEGDRATGSARRARFIPINAVQQGSVATG